MTTLNVSSNISKKEKTNIEPHTLHDNNYPYLLILKDSKIQKNITLLEC